MKKLILRVCQDITGIDETSTISWCKQHHDLGTWYADNLEDPKIGLEEGIRRTYQWYRDYVKAT